jgi:4-diphosphocytidyl-2-C-methyl-D-erythritol kinase
MMKTFTGAPSLFSLKTPAKINWFLSIDAKRVDGYHDIRSLMQCVSLFDHLSIEHADSIDVTGNLDIPLDSNLVYKAALLLKKRTSCRMGAKITLKKDIPVSAGLGGGSSDAACILSGLNRLWGLNLNNSELSTIGAEIGSDVPFFFNGPFALAEGRGEKVTPLNHASSVILLLVNPPVPVSTAWAYACYDAIAAYKLTKKVIDIKLFCQALEKQDFSSLDSMLGNDLEEAVIRECPLISEIKQKLGEKGALIVAMSGSGPAVFGVFAGRKEAEKAARDMKPYWCAVVETLV